MDATKTLHLPEISDRHARGLRRDLFRQLADHRAQHRHVLDARLTMVAMPLRGVRERRNSYLRAARAIRDACFGFVMADGFISGVLIEPCVMSHDDGDEAALAMTTVLIMMGKQYWEMIRLDAGRVSHHVVERMFQRLRTTSTAEVSDELAVAFSWARLLQLELAFAMDQAGIVEFPIPSKRGVLLARRDPETRRFNARTWLRSGMNRRVDTSVAALQRWHVEKDPDLDRRARSLVALADEPEHAWWRRDRADGPVFPDAAGAG